MTEATTSTPERTRAPGRIQAARRIPSPAGTSGRPLTTTVQCKLTAQRVELFTRRGLDQAQAVGLAARCQARDLDLMAPTPTRPGGTGMAACMECAHLGRAGGDRYRCGNWRELEMSRGAALMPGRFVVEFHRCQGFAFAQRRG